MMRVFEKLNENPKCELDYKNAYTLLVAVVLSAQSTDKGVNKATKALFEIADTPQKMLELGLEGLKSHIKTIGLYNNKAKNIIKLSEELVQKYGGQVPQNREDLESLAGVGRKTANVVLNVWFDEPTLAVDTHVFRISHRLGLSEGKTPLEVETDLMKVLPEKYVKKANHWFVLFGRYTCKALRPDCVNCPVKSYCKSGDKRAG
ncbi:MAG: endonuclease III [Alphaproteobacteria bacterium]|nr:endonuclease III [Alphaproteobacteria bacterium]